MGVTKNVDVARINQAVEAGISILGENRVQEAAQKRPLVKQAAQWHMIGHLQTNKVRKALQIFDMIHSVDSAQLAERLQIECEKQQRQIEILIQVNTSGETSKFGVAPPEALGLAREVAGFPNLRLRGLMTIGAFVEDMTIVRQCFRRLRDTANEIKDAQVRGVEMSALSMGMSNDFEIAIEEGATLIRLGTALFGARG